MAMFVVDFQAFKTLENEYILKELAIVAVHSNLTVHCVVKPEVPFTCLPTKLRSNVNYLTRTIHGISWDDGYVSYSDAIKLLKDTLKNASMIYCKGSERVKWVKKNLGMFVTDLDNVECPKKDMWPPDQLQLFLQCPYNRHYGKSNYRCALQLALKYRDWLQRRL